MSGDAPKIRILRERQVLSRLNFHRSTLWRQIAKGAFPRPIKIGANSNGWIEAEIDAWLHARMDERQPPREKAHLAHARNLETR